MWDKGRLCNWMNTQQTRKNRDRILYRKVLYPSEGHLCVGLTRSSLLWEIRWTSVAEWPRTGSSSRTSWNVSHLPKLPLSNDNDRSVKIIPNEKISFLRNQSIFIKNFTGVGAVVYLWKRNRLTNRVTFNFTILLWSNY